MFYYTLMDLLFIFYDLYNFVFIGEFNFSVELSNLILLIIFCFRKTLFLSTSEIITRFTCYDNGKIIFNCSSNIIILFSGIMAGPLLTTFYSVSAIVSAVFIGTGKKDTT